MKHLRLFENTEENWSLSKIEDIYDDLQMMSRLIFEYLNLNKFIGHIIDKKYYNFVLEEFWFDEQDDDFFSVRYKYISQIKRGNNFEYTFTKKQFDDLVEYMNNPQVYKDAKKYNL